MQKPLKILVVRFSSIGDIVLTSPVVRCLKNQLTSKVHFLTKSKYECIVRHNIFIEKIYTIENSVNDVISELKLENYDYIVDLHNNIRSFRLKLLGVKTFKVCKESFKKSVYIKLGINLLSKDHVVDRYMKTIDFFNIKNDNKGLDYFLGSDVKVNFDVDQKYLIWCIGASFSNKKISINQIAETCSKVNFPVVLIGGNEDSISANKIIEFSSNNNITNFCGLLSLDQSAFLIKKSCLVISNDTGPMHIAAAFKKQIISLWGCTKPSLGFYPYMTNSEAIMIVSEKSKRPCSKHGSYCRFSSKGCVKDIPSQEISEAISDLIFIE